LTTQAKLLRVLQESEVRAVGEEQSRKIDVRILAATHKNLETLVQQGTFRDDLYYRLAVVKLEVPPLRERKDDIPLLTRFFLARHAERFGVGHLSATAELVERLCQHEWPGNVRELENALENLVVLSPPEALDLELLPFGGGESPDQVSRGAGSMHASREALEPQLEGASLHLREHMERYERRLVLEALRQTGGNRSLAAQRLGISRVTLHDKLNKYGIKRGEDGAG
jgi:DNA-binding NtrC family response regulator